MIELITASVIAVVAMIAGAWIFAKGQKIGADIVWRVRGNDQPLFDTPDTELLPSTTEEMDAQIEEEERNNPSME